MTSPSAPSAVRIALALLLLGGLTTALLPARPAEPAAPGGSPPGKGRFGGEEEEPAPPPRGKVVQVEEGGERPAPPPRRPPTATVDLARAAREAAHPAVRALFAELAVP